MISVTAATRGDAALAEKKMDLERIDLPGLCGACLLTGQSWQLPGETRAWMMDSTSVFFSHQLSSNTIAVNPEKV